MSTEYYADYIKKTTFDPESHSTRSKIEEAATDVKKKPASKTPKVEVEPTEVPEENLDEKGKGLWANIHAKRARGEKPNPPGHPDRPSAADLKRSQNKEEVAKEELHGDQHKLDHNKDNKIDKADMKMVRKKGAVKDHPMAEKKSLASLRNTSMLDGKDRLKKMAPSQSVQSEATFKVNVEGLPTMYIDGAGAGEIKTSLRKQLKDPKTITSIEKISPSEKKKELRAKVAEEDRVDEISGKTLASYAQGASSDMYGRALRKGMDIQRGSSDKDNDRKIKNRGSGIAKANMRMAGKMAKHNEDVEENYIVQKYSAGKKDGAPKSFGGNLKKATAHARKMGGDHRVHDAGNVAKHNEDTETVDELNRDTLASYISKASDASKHRGMPTKKVDNRYSGVAKASKKIDKMEEDYSDQKAHLKKVGKGGQVSYTNSGKKMSGKYGGMKNKGGRSYAMVHHDTHSAMVPLPQINHKESVDSTNEGIMDAINKVKDKATSVGKSISSSYKKGRNIAAPGKGMNLLKKQ